MTEEILQITKRDAVALLQKAVEAKGEDYTYTQVEKPAGYSGCVYTDADSNPSCIVGHALAYAGVPIEVLHAIDWGGAVVLDYPEFDTDEEADAFEKAHANEPDEAWMVKTTLGTGMDETGIDESSVNYWLRTNDVTITDDALLLFSAVQRRQDNGTAWGEAVNGAIRATGGAVK